MKIRKKGGVFSLLASVFLFLSAAALGTAGLRAVEPEAGAAAGNRGESYAQIEPAGLALMTAGLVGLGIWARYKRRKP